VNGAPKSAAQNRPATLSHEGIGTHDQLGVSIALLGMVLQLPAQ